VAQALTAPFAVAAIVLCVAGIAKLRAPAGASEAVGVGRGAVRVFALAELALGAWALAAPAPLAAALVAAVYVGFAAAQLVLAHRHTPCGCFGERDQPASRVQSLISCALSSSAALAAAWTPHGLTWVLGHSAVLVLGVGGAAYAVVVGYTQLPLLWSAWEGATR
jgi:hypothetical protein